jgi:hypothetical protein
MLAFLEGLEEQNEGPPEGFLKENFMKRWESRRKERFTVREATPGRNAKPHQIGTFIGESEEIVKQQFSPGAKGRRGREESASSDKGSSFRRDLTKSTARQPMPRKR